MNQKKWTLLLLGENPEGIRQFTVSPRVLRWIAGGFGVFSVFVLVLSGFLLFSGGAFIRANSLARENALLTSELQQFRVRVDGLEETIAQLGEQDSRVRRWREWMPWTRRSWRWESGARDLRLQRGDPSGPWTPL